MSVVIEPSGFDPWAALQAYQAKLTGGSFGATAVFVGTMRDFNQGDEVQGMSLEHYPGMTEHQLEAIVAEAAEQWPLIDTLIHHRVGDIHPNDPIVLTAVWSAHRAAAFEANRFLMEALKSRAPFWKRETLDDGQQRWVEKNTPGY
ncbi:MAG: molybdenum cofactor biosynthesis protein MoaE [Granulosicoccaceae bacterium]